MRRLLILLALPVIVAVAGAAWWLQADSGKPRAAYAIVDKLIVGTPAPPEVRQQPARFGHGGELIPVPHPGDPQLEKARVAAVLDSSVGTVYLFSSPNERGPCASVWIQGDRGYQGRLNLSSVCGTVDQSFYASGSQQYRGKTVNLFFGRAAESAHRVELRIGSHMVTLPLVGRWFLAELPDQPSRFVSYQANGHVFENHPFLHFSRPPRVTRAPHQVTREREVTQIRVERGEEITLFAARASNGGYCQIVRSSQRPSNRGCGLMPPKPGEIAVSAMSFGGTPGGVLLLVGPVGARVTTLDLRYQDGRQRTIPLHEGWVLFEIMLADYTKGHRPQSLTARDNSGRTVTTTRLPWVSVTG